MWGVPKSATQVGGKLQYLPIGLSRIFFIKRSNIQNTYRSQIIDAGTDDYLAVNIKSEI